MCTSSASSPALAEVIIWSCNMCMRIVAEAHGTSNNGDRYFGMLQVANCQNSADYAYILGLRNSQDKTFPAGLAVGSRVLVCSNLRRDHQRPPAHQPDSSGPARLDHACRRPTRRALERPGQTHRRL